MNNHGIEPDLANTVCVDLDGVIIDFHSCKENCNYECYPQNHDDLKRFNCPVMKDVVDSMNEIKKLGLKIIIFTGRVEAEREVTEKWLKKNNIVYDELIMNKLRAFIYIDDFGYKFDNWFNVLDEINKRRLENSR